MNNKERVVVPPPRLTACCTLHGMFENPTPRCPECIRVGRSVGLNDPTIGVVEKPVALLVEGEANLVALLPHLGKASIWFAVMPHPDDSYVVYCKQDAEHIVLKLIAEHCVIPPSDGELWPENRADLIEVLTNSTEEEIATFFVRWVLHLIVQLEGMLKTHHPLDASTLWAHRFEKTFGGSK